MHAHILMKPTNYRLFIVLVLIFYLLVAYKSSGYHQEDEHYQIIEFANYKLGLIPVNRLAWEFPAQIRPGFQPLICYLFLQVFNLFGINDGYDIAFLLRAISGILSILVIRKFVEVYKGNIDASLQPYFIFFSYLLWFLPYINVRFSSESWSGMSFLVALIVVERYKNGETLKKYILLGTFLGISILFRYQSALLAFGVMLWLLIVHMPRLKYVLTTTSLIFIVLCFGVAFDYWLYGNLTCSIYNYFNVNLIKGVSSNFGVSPFYEYLYYILTAPGIIGIFILLSFVIVLFRNPKNILIWTIVPFVFIHSLIPHKELRFLFPIANLTPLLLIQAYSAIFLKNGLNPIRRKFKYAIISILIIIFGVNSVGLISIASTGAGTKKTAVTEWIHRTYAHQKFNIIIVNGQNPYIDWGPPKNSYYSSAELNLDYIKTIWQDDFITHKKKGYTNLLVISDNDITGERAINLLKKHRAIKVYQNIPYYLSRVYNLYDPSLNDLNLNVYEFR